MKERKREYKEEKGGEEEERQAEGEIKELEE